MTSQIFKTKIPHSLLIDFLEENANKTDKCFILSHDVYKKAIYNNSIHTFLEKCKSHYYMSKKKYIDRKLTYNSFVTVIRQICKINDISIVSEIKYDKSTYNIIYYIYCLEDNETKS